MTGREAATAFCVLIALAALPIQVAVGAPLSGAIPINRGSVDFKVAVEAPQKSRDVRLWVPYPVSADDQTIENMRISGNYTNQAVYRMKETGALVLYVEWREPADLRQVSLSFDVTAKERKSKGYAKKRGSFPVEVEPYLRETKFIPIGGEVAKIVRQITQGKTSVTGKARAIYDWVVENTFRDPTVQGCGVGIVEVTLAKRGGKCVDISSVFVSLARSAGIPAREIFGFRLGKKEGVQDITSGHHCWAEFYHPGYGWVSVDPADVRKLMLAEKLDLGGAQKYSDYYFGAVGPNRVVLGRGGRNFYLDPPQNDGPLNYFMYPYAEVDGKKLPWLAAQEGLTYTITYTRRAPSPVTVNHR